MLVLAGPGAGKTYCLIERIRFLIEKTGENPERICAFTFTNKAAEEISSRLSDLPDCMGEKVRRGTFHAFCSALLREFPEAAGLSPGFGIADDEYQRSVLRRIGVPIRYHGRVLKEFTGHRLRGDPLEPRDVESFARYSAWLSQRNVVDFDGLLEKALLLFSSELGAKIRGRYDVILVDEFQDLNPLEYKLVCELAADHRHVFAVGDDEQSIYSWAGADPGVFRTFVNEFKITKVIELERNYRCPCEIFDVARVLIGNNPTLFDNRSAPTTDRNTGFPIVARLFDEEAAELQWICDEIIREKTESGLAWGDFAVLYRLHEIGEQVEATLITQKVPCRLTQNRALADDPIVKYVVAALRVMRYKDDPVYLEEFLASVLPSTLMDEARVQSQRDRIDLPDQLNRMAARLPRTDANAKRIRRWLYSMRNLPALAERQRSADGVVQELLAQGLPSHKNKLEDRHDDLSDPAENADVLALLRRLRQADAEGRKIWIESLGGAEIPLKAILSAGGFRFIFAGGVCPDDAERVTARDGGALGIALTIFKLAQLRDRTGYEDAFHDFVAIDVETTDDDMESCEVVEIAAVRVRNGAVVEELSEFVKPGCAINEEATKIHGISALDVQDARPFKEVWPEFRKFCGEDIVVAHNGYGFDFPILSRMVANSGGELDLVTFDSLPIARSLITGSRQLPDLAARFKIETGRSHRALDDARCLAAVFLRLEQEKLARARKTALVGSLDELGIALALADPEILSAEAKLFLEMCVVFTLGRYSNCLEDYERERAGNESLPSADFIIDRLGGREAMARIRRERTPADRYPAAMRRLALLMRDLPNTQLEGQLTELLERISLSRIQGVETDRDRVSLLTLHSTKGLEFSRVFIVGVEDAQMPGGTESRSASKKEIEESRRLLYVGMTRAQDRLYMTCTVERRTIPSRGHRFLTEMGITPHSSSAPTPQVPPVPLP